MSKINYYFDAKKLAGTNNTTKEDWVKTVFKDIMYNATTQTLKQQGNEVFEVIWGNEDLKAMFDLSDTAPKTPIEQFKDIISNTSNSFYNFIKVK